MKIILSEKKLHELTNGWEIKNKKLSKKFTFDNFDEVINFVNNVAKIAKKQNHHPEVKFGYNTVEVSIYDHEKNKISDKCYKFVNAINKT